jgi:uncharacterized glyoxalase superfamily protein PhnB
MDTRAPTFPTNRSVPACTIIPELAYADVGEAAAWLCTVFGFAERLRIGNHRAQLLFGDGAIVVTERRTPDAGRSAMLVRVADVDAHYALTVARGARIVTPPNTYPFGERQYTVEDLAGHHWTFSQSVADVDPASWGAMVPTGAGTSP